MITKAPKLSCKIQFLKVKEYLEGWLSFRYNLELVIIIRQNPSISSYYHLLVKWVKEFEGRIPISVANIFADEYHPAIKWQVVCPFIDVEEYFIERIKGILRVRAPGFVENPKSMLTCDIDLESLIKDLLNFEAEFKHDYGFQALKLPYVYEDLWPRHLRGEEAMKEFYNRISVLKAEDDSIDWYSESMAKSARNILPRARTEKYHPSLLRAHKIDDAMEIKLSKITHILDNFYPYDVSGRFYLRTHTGTNSMESFWLQEYVETLTRFPLLGKFYRVGKPAYVRFPITFKHAQDVNLAISDLYSIFLPSILGKNQAAVFVWGDFDIEYLGDPERNFLDELIRFMEDRLPKIDAFERKEALSFGVPGSMFYSKLPWPKQLPPNLPLPAPNLPVPGQVRSRIGLLHFLIWGTGYGR